MPTRRRVRFLPRTAVRLVPNLDDYTAQEYRATWTTAEESEASKDHLVDTIRQMRKEGSSFEDNDNYSGRGLEALISSQARVDKKKRRTDAIDAVMDEQDRQWSNNLPYDEERIAKASVQVTNISRLMASATAAQDSAYVREHVIPEFRAQCQRLSSDKFDELEEHVMQRSYPIAVGGRGITAQTNTNRLAASA